MALTPEERLQRRLTDPYYSLAESLAKPSLSDQKKMSLAAASVEKERKLDPAAAIADEQLNLDALVEGRATGPGLLDIAESSLYQGGMQLSDFVTGSRLRSNEEIQAAADAAAGVTPEARRELVEEPQQRVIESLAQGDYLGAIPEAIKAGPGTLAESAVFIPELAAGALLTNVGGKAIVKRRGKKALEGAGKLFDRVKKTRGQKMLEGVPKAAGQVSIATADLTQRQINDYRELHGVDPTREEAATMFALNMATMMIEPTIIKKLFIPDFKGQVGKEIKQLGANIVGGSNLRSIASRVTDGALKVTAAAGAEAGQEYFQTWAESLNVQMGPEQRQNFFQSALEIIGDKDNQLQALAASYLGGGAGGTARAAITAPAVAAGTAVDTTKGTAKVAAKTAKAAARTAAKPVRALADKAALEVLSEEELEVLKAEYETNKQVKDESIRNFESAVDVVKSAKSIQEIRDSDPEIAKVAAAAQQSANLTDEDLQSDRKFEGLKADIIRAYRGNIGLLKTELQAERFAAVGKKGAQNIATKSVRTAKAAMDAVAPAVDQVIEEVQQYGKKAVEAVKEVRSSTALGMIEIAANAGKEDVKQIVEAAKSLSMDDLQRTASVISEIRPELANQLNRVIQDKKRALERTGLRSKIITTAENLNPIIKDVAKVGKVAADKAAPVRQAINQAMASTIEDLDAVAQIETAINAVKETMSTESLAVMQRKLKRVKDRLSAEPTTKEKVTKAVKDTAETVVKKAAPVAKKATEKVAAKAAPKVKVSPAFEAVIQGVEKTLKDPKMAETIVGAAPDFVKQMKRYGVKTRSDFLAFVDQFPGIQDNVEFFKEIEKEFPSDVSARELFDNLRTKAVDTTQAIKDAYNAMNPPECKV